MIVYKITQIKKDSRLFFLSKIGEWKSMARDGVSFKTFDDALDYADENTEPSENIRIETFEVIDKVYKSIDVYKVPKKDLLDQSIVTKDDIDILFWSEDEVPFKGSNYTIEYLYENREEIRKMLFKKIGMLIDFHDSFANTYTVTQQYKRTNQDGCSGCEICNEIQRLRLEIERPYMRKVYDKLNYHHPRFLSAYGQHYTSQTAEELALLMHDYHKLQKQGFSEEVIASMYGVTAVSLRNIKKKIMTSPMHRYVIL